MAVFHQDMYRYAAWLSRDKAIAEDVVQDAAQGMEVARCAARGRGRETLVVDDCQA